jgi:hypothetical protein
LIERTKLGGEGFKTKGVSMNNTDLTLFSYLLDNFLGTKKIKHFTESLRNISSDNIYGSKFESYMDIKVFLKLYNRIVDDNMSVHEDMEDLAEIKITIEDLEILIGKDSNFDKVYEQIEGALNLDFKRISGAHSDSIERCNFQGGKDFKTKIKSAFIDEYGTQNLKSGSKENLWAFENSIRVLESLL